MNPEDCAPRRVGAEPCADLADAAVIAVARDTETDGAGVIVVLDAGGDDKVRASGVTVGAVALVAWLAAARGGTFDAGALVAEAPGPDAPLPFPFGIIASITLRCCAGGAAAAVAPADDAPVAGTWTLYTVIPNAGRSTFKLT